MGDGIGAAAAAGELVAILPRYYVVPQAESVTADRFALFLSVMQHACVSPSELCNQKTGYGRYIFPISNEILFKIIL